MVQSRLEGVRISGIVSVVPAGVKTIEEESNLLGLSDLQMSLLKRDLGVEQRHITMKNECTSDLCEHAAKYILSKLEYDPLTVDCLIMVTQTPDYFQPATSCVLHEKLGLSKNCAAFDINLGCSGYVYGLWLASIMISSRSCKRVMMLAGDTISRCVSPQDRTTAPQFGDAGSVTMIENGIDDDPITFALHSDGKGHKHIIIPAGAFRNKSSRKTAEIMERENGNARSEEHLYMNGTEVLFFSIREIPPLVEEVLSISKWGKEEVDYFIFHQVNKFIIKNIVRNLRIPMGKTYYNVFQKYGNQSSASIPVTICENLSSTVIDNPIKVVLAGFGTGLSWAACALSLGPMECYPVIVLNSSE